MVCLVQIKILSKASMAAQAFVPWTWKAEAGEPLWAQQPGLHSISQATQGYIKKKNLSTTQKKNLKNKSENISGDPWVHSQHISVFKWVNLKDLTQESAEHRVLTVCTKPFLIWSILKTLGGKHLLFWVYWSEEPKILFPEKISSENNLSFWVPRRAAKSPLADFIVCCPKLSVAFPVS